MAIGARTFNYRRPATRRRAPTPLNYSDLLRRAGGNQVPQAPQAGFAGYVGAGGKGGLGDISASPPADDTGYTQGGYNPGGATVGGQGPIADVPLPEPPGKPRIDPDLREPGGGGGNGDGDTTIIINTGGGGGSYDDKYGKKDRKGGGGGNERYDDSGGFPPTIPPPPTGTLPVLGTNVPERDPYQVAFNNLLMEMGLTGQNQTWVEGPRGGYRDAASEFRRRMLEMGYGGQLGQQFGVATGEMDRYSGTAGVDPYYDPRPIYEAARGNRFNRMLVEWLQRLGTQPVGFDLPAITSPGAERRGA